MSSKIATWLGTAAVLFAASTSHAAPIMYEYGGVITSADSSTGVAPGTRFSGMFTYDPEHKTSGTGMGEGFRSYYYGLSYVGRTPTDGSGITLQIGGQTVLANPGGVQVEVSERDYPGQQVFNRGVSAPDGPFTRLSVSTENLGAARLIDLEMTNLTRSVFGSLAPPTVLNLVDFPDARLSVHESYYSQSKILYTGTIDTLTVVPEPACATVLCATVGFLAYHHRRPRSARQRRGHGSVGQNSFQRNSKGSETNGTRLRANVH